ncbi:MAG TPA: LamG domain-containing protein [Allosphingosinicella sp.]|nr:LamG domain-containing protein [Allosphingosinicella sp.]
MKVSTLKFPLPAMILGMAAMITAVPAQGGCTPPPPDMDAWYSLNGNGADRILHLDAVASGSVTYDTGQMVGQSLIMNGGGYLEVPSGPVLNQGLGDFSIDAWIRVLPSGLAGLRTLIDKRGSVSGGVRGWSLFTFDGRLGLQLADGGSAGGYSNYVDSRKLTFGLHHVAVSIDRDDSYGIRFYIDAVAGKPLDPTGRKGNLNNNGPTYFGFNGQSNAATNYFHMDEVELFDRVLTPAEVAAIFGADSAGKCT